MASTAESLPPEIVQHIFKQFPTPFIVHVHEERVEFPFYLGHICSSWRHIFLSMRAEFWSTVILRSDRECVSAQCQQSAQFVKEFLKRSRGCQISIEIDTSYPPPCDILDLLAAESTRWRNIAIGFDFFGSEALSTVKNQLPQLRSLIVSDEDIYSRVFKGYEDVFANTPNLTHVRLYNPVGWHLNWSSLTVLHLLELVRCDNLVANVLPQAVCLEELLIRSNAALVPNAAVTLPRLRNLFIFGRFSLLSLLRTPSLEQFYIENLGLDSWKQLTEVWNAFSSRSCFQLHRVMLGQCNPGTLQFILSHAPNLKSLDLLHSVKHLNDLPHLTCGSGHLPLALQLETFRVQLEWITEGKLERLTAMIASRTTARAPSVQPLKQVICQLGIGELKLKDKINMLERVCVTHGVQFSVEQMDTRVQLGRFYQNNFLQLPFEV